MQSSLQKARRKKWPWCYIMRRFWSTATCVLPFYYVSLFAICSIRIVRAYQKEGRKRRGGGRWTGRNAWGKHVFHGHVSSGVICPRNFLSKFYRLLRILLGVQFCFGKLEGEGKRITEIWTTYIHKRAQSYDSRQISFLLSPSKCRKVIRIFDRKDTFTSVSDMKWGWRVGVLGQLGEGDQAGTSRNFSFFLPVGTVLQVAADLTPFSLRQWMVRIRSSLSGSQSKKGEIRGFLATVAEKEGKVGWEVRVEMKVKK